MRRKFVVLPVSLALTIAALVFPINNRRARAQVAAPLLFQYAVKFVCGKSPTAGQPQIVATGNYFTAINVHNPHTDSVGLRKKFAVALPSEKSGPVSPFFNAELGPDRAFEIDCVDIWKHLHMNSTFVKGFAVIESKVELDVVAVYTASGASGQIETMDVERVAARRTSSGSGSPDLIPVPGPNANFCRRDSSGRLIVTIRNQGPANAGGSQIRVEYSTGGPVASITPPIPAGGTVDVPAPIPANCFRPDCSFRIIVDDQGQVSESNETNNAASGTCIG